MGRTHRYPDFSAASPIGEARRSDVLIEYLPLSRYWLRRSFPPVRLIVAESVSVGIHWIFRVLSLQHRPKRLFTELDYISWAATCEAHPEMWVQTAASFLGPGDPDDRQNHCGNEWDRLLHKPSMVGDAGSTASFLHPVQQTRSEVLRVLRRFQFVWGGNSQQIVFDSVASLVPCWLLPPYPF